MPVGQKIAASRFHDHPTVEASTLSALDAELLILRQRGTDPFFQHSLHTIHDSRFIRLGGVPSMEKSSGAPMVLIADDNIDDCVIASRAWDESRLGFEVQFVHNGREVLDFLHCRGRFYNMTTRPEPCMILLDLNMPRMDGRQVLLELRLVPQFTHIPVVVFSDSRMPKDMAESETMGAFEYISKPENFDEYVEIIKDLAQRVLNKPKRYAYANR